MPSERSHSDTPDPFGGVANERHSALRNSLAVGQGPQVNLTKHTLAYTSIFCFGLNGVVVWVGAKHPKNNCVAIPITPINGSFAPTAIRIGMGQGSAVEPDKANTGMHRHFLLWFE